MPSVMAEALILARAARAIAPSRNGDEEVLVQVFPGGVFLQVVERAHAPAREERKEIQLARLQRLVRVKQIAEEFRVRGENSGLFVARPAGFLPELFRLIRDFALGFFERRFQRWIDFGDGIVPAIEQFADLARVFFQFCAEPRGNIGGAEFLAHDLRAGPNVFHRHSVLFEQSMRLAVHKRESSAGKEDGLAMKQFRIENFRLSKIRNFRWAADVSNGRKQIVLQDGTKERVWTERLRRSGDGAGKLLGGPAHRVGLEIRAVRMNGFAAAIAKIKQGGAAAGDFYLRGKAGAVEFPVSREQGVVQCNTVFRGLAKNGFAEPMKARIERVEDDHSVRRKNAGKEFSERGSVGFFRRVARAKNRAQLSRRRAAQHDGGGANHLFDLLAELLRSHRRGRAVPRGQYKFIELAVVEEGGVANLVEVVIFRGHPKNRNGIHAGFGQQANSFECGEHFVKRIGRTAEEPNLLPGNDGGGASFEAPDVLDGGGAGAERFVLFTQDRGNGAAARLRIVKRGGEPDGVFKRRLMREKGFYAGKIVEESEMERGLMRKFAKRQGATLHGLLDDTPRIRSQQIDEKVVVRKQVVRHELAKSATAWRQARVVAAAGSRFATNFAIAAFVASLSGRSGARGTPPRYPRKSITNFTPAIPFSDTTFFDATDNLPCRSRAWSYIFWRTS